MPLYGSVDSVRPYLGDRPLSATTTPNETNVETWIDQYEDELLAILEAVGISTTAFTTRGERQIARWVSAGVASEVRRSHAAGGGDGGNDDGNMQQSEWNVRLKHIQSDVSFYAQLLTGPDVAGGKSLMRSHVSAGAYNEPRFTMDETF